MSVPKDKRKQGELAVNVAARGACNYVLRITENRKKFPEAHQDLVELLRRTAIDIDLKCWRANNTIVGRNEQAYHGRLRLEEEAAKLCMDILELINITKPLVHMDGKRYRYLVTQYAGLRKMIRAWYKSDRDRLKPKRETDGDVG